MRIVHDEQTGPHCGSISVEVNVYVTSVTVVIVTFSGHNIIYEPVNEISNNVAF